MCTGGGLLIAAAGAVGLSMMALMVPRAHVGHVALAQGAIAAAQQRRVPEAPGGGVANALAGACCLPDGTCVEVQNQNACNSLGGTFQGGGTSCANVVCPQPNAGACCFTDGSCQDGLTDADCVVAGGTYQGDGSVCAKTFCRECALDIDCDDGDPCNGLETCVGGICQPGIPVDCDDGNACNGLETCVGGICQPGIPLNCDDGNACTADSCDPLVGCINTPINCDDGNACTADTCDPVLGCINTPINCDDANACTADSCDPVLGCINTPINCDEANACTADNCDPLVGCINTPINCDDANACTADSCDPLVGCINTPIIPCCGNGVPEAGEDCSNCPADIQCPPDTLCIAGTCELLSAADFTGLDDVPDGCVDAFDLSALLGAWCSEFVPGVPPNPPCKACLPGNLFVDISGPFGGPDGCVDAFDLAKLLAEWCSVSGGNPCGTCFPPP